MSGITVKKAASRLRAALDNRHGVAKTEFTANALGTRLVALGNGAIARADLPEGTSGAVEVINAGRLAAARYRPVTGGTVVSSGSSGGTSTSVVVSTSDHGALSGLSDDDHTQYFNTTRGDARYTLLTRNLTAGAGLTGGGTLAADRTFDVGAGTLITVAADSVSLSNGSAQYQFITTGATPFTPAYASLSTLKGNGLTYATGVLTLGTPTALSATTTDAVTTSSHSHSIDSTIARSAITITGTGSLGGGGDLTTNRTITLNTPGSLSVSSSNSSATNHTHAVTSSSSPGAAASLLASDASGYLTLVRLTTSDRVITPLLTSSAALQLTTSSGNISLDASTDLIQIKASNNLRTENYASQTTGWAVDYNGSADFRYLFVDEMHAKAFIVDLDQALAGGQIITKSVTLLYVAFVAPAAGGTAFLNVKDLPSATGMACFQNGDMIRLRQFSRSAGSLSIADCWGTVTLDNTWTFTITATGGTFTMTVGANTTSAIAYNASAATLQTALTGLASVGSGNCTVSKVSSVFTINFVGTLAGQQVGLTANVASLTGGTGTLLANYGQGGFDSATKSQQYVFTRSTAPNAGAMTASTVVAADSIVLDYGVSGNGYYEVNAIDGVYGVNSPYAQLVTWTTHPATGSVVRGRYGKLSGLSIGTSNEMGIAVGSGFTSSDQYFKASNVDVIMNNVNSTWNVSGTPKVKIDATSGLQLVSGNAVYNAIDWSDSVGGTVRTRLIAYLDTGRNTSYWHVYPTDTTSYGNYVQFSASGSTAGLEYASYYVRLSNRAGFGLGELLISEPASYVATTDFKVRKPGATHEIHFTNGHTNVVNSQYPTTVDSEISNDSATYKGLMLVGNKSSTHSRKVLIYDQLSIGGTHPTFSYINQLMTKNGNANASLVSDTVGYSGAVLFNAAVIAQTANMATFGQTAYMGGQFNSLTAPGMFYYDANANYFAFFTGTVGLAEGASITWSEKLRIDGLNSNILINGAANGGGQGIIGIKNAITVPVSNPALGGVVYTQAGALKYRGSSGTITTLAPA